MTAQSPESPARHGSGPAPLRALMLALGDLASPAVLRVLTKSLILTLLLLAGAMALLYLAGQWALTRWPILGEAERDLAGVAMLIALIVLAWFLFRAVAILVIGFFADDVAKDIEARHYPHTAMRAVPVPFLRELQLGLASVGRLILFNLIALPLYILLLVTGIGTPLLALIVNGALMSKDLQALVRARHPDVPPLPRSQGMLLGLVAAGAFLVPLANVLAPIVGTAMAVHMFHQRRNSSL